jgi:oligopeptide transport system ATP-binding protein
LKPNVLLEIKDVHKYFPIKKGIIIERQVAEVKAVKNADFCIYKGETLGLVGESGSGKTTVGRCILQLDKPTWGEVHYDGQNICTLNEEKMRGLRRKMQIIFQDPYSSLNPRHNIETIVSEPMIIHRLASGAEQRRERVKQLLTTVGLRPEMTERYPHMFSGGQRQRIGIARALATRPEFIVCDEPVSALDVSIQSQIVNLLSDLREKLNLTMLFISHDLSMVKYISHRIAVMYLGQIVELADSKELYKEQLHPYTKALLSAVPIPDPRSERKRQRLILSGEIPSPMNPPRGCTFHPRCPVREKRCMEDPPEYRNVGDRFVACHLVA